MITDQLYYQDSRLLDFTARIHSIDRDRIFLDRTAFYPEGGGQPADRGTMGGVPVLTVQKEGAQIYHQVDSSHPGFTPLKVGQEVICRVDSQHRQEYIQQHTGQHLLSAAAYTRGFQTLSVSQGGEYTTIEFDTHTLTKETIIEMEDSVNLWICENLPVTTREVDSERFDPSLLRRPPKVKGKIRIVTVEGIDQAACGGVHAASTGEVQLVKFAGQESIRGNTRTYWLIGGRAMEDFRRKFADVNTLANLLAIKPEELQERVRGEVEEKRALSVALNGEKQKRFRLQVENLCEGAITLELNNEEKDFLKIVIPQLTEFHQDPLLVINDLTSEGQLQWVVYVPPNISFDFKPLRLCLQEIQGKGGGRSPFWQGILLDRKDKNQLLTKWQELIG